MLYYPRSFLKLILLALTLVMLPLGFAFYNAAKSFDRLANQSQRAVFDAVRATQAGKTLRDRVVDLERSARQYLVLEEPSVFEAYKKIHGDFVNAARRLETNPLDPEQRAQLKQLAERESKLYGTLLATPDRSFDVKTMIGEYERLGKSAQQLFVSTDALVERHVETMRSTTAKAQEAIFWQGIALVPLAVLVAIGATILITRPFEQINDAIRQMGDGELLKPVSVVGPHDLVNLGRRLDWLRLRLLELEQQKNKFLQRISHELKTPLTALREGSELLADEVVGKLTEQQREVCTILRHKSIQLQRLIENLLNYSATEFHRTLPRPELLDISPILTKVVAEQKLALRARGVRCKYQGPPIQLEADPEMLRVIFDNLLSNAIKYSPQGGAIIINGAVRVPHAIIEVVDQGPGVTDVDAHRIFDAFYEGQTPSESPVKGSGLGLAICRDYVNAHHGRIEVVPGVAQGALFRVTLPLEQGSQP
jgi:two-component system, NtrC family, sensor histidine kinase GlrK